MKPALHYILYGIGIWLVLFALGGALFAVVDQRSALFDTIMSLAIGTSAGWLSFLYLRKRERAGLAAGALAGAGWAAMAGALDAPLFLFGTINMAMPDYFADIGLTYAMIPIVAAVVGAALAYGRSQVARAPGEGESA
jgi:hypothetical protein